ncbi:MAG: glycoside hydrolase family 25 protein [Bacilli bacterium]|nr:glycoside hydrolase family 25 protein [Bacilli bacterium]
MQKGIDVSAYQGKIDWTRIKPYIDFAIIRCGWGNDSEAQDDIYYERNSKACEDLGIPYGVYLFSYATTLDEARSEVLHTLRLIRNKKLEYPVFLDVEEKRQMSLPKETLTEIVKYYCEEMERHGYYVGIYASLDRFKSNLDSRDLDRFDKWVAEWNNRFTYEGKAGMWQQTSYEELPGIRGRVDGDIAFYDYPKIIRDANLNHLGDEKYKFKVGDKVYVSGNVYENNDMSNVITTLCDQEYVIERIIPNTLAPYQIALGFVSESSLYQKVLND